VARRDLSREIEAFRLIGAAMTLHDATVATEEGLDPQDWESVRALGHRMVDDLVAFHAGLSARPAWQPVPAAARSAILKPPNAEGIGDEAAYADFRSFIAEYPYGNLHPRAWGWVNGTGTTLAAFAEMWAAGMNSNCWGGEQSASYVEASVLDWCRQLFGFPPDATGVLLSGGSEANLVGLAAGREAATQGSVSSRGIHALDQQLVVYASEQAHNSIDKAVALLGIGWDNLRHIDTDSEYRMDVRALERAIAEDRKAGRTPACGPPRRER
jgi:glutamate/tyrosine decarboxylase-like PLP-dependent enzyme